MSFFKLKEYSLIKVSGSDTSVFLNGQLTNNVNQLDKNSGHIQVRLNLKGQIEFFFYLIKDSSDSNYFIMITSDQADSLIENLDKFVISEDVIFEKCDDKPALSFNISDCLNENFFRIVWSAQVATLKFVAATEFLSLPDYKFSPQDDLSGNPFNEGTLIGSRINQTILNDIAIDYTKGCFLGQEVCAKIENNRKEAYFPMGFLCQKDLRLDETVFNNAAEKKKFATVVRKLKSPDSDNNYFKLNVHRDFRLSGKNQKIVINDQEVEGELFHFPYNGSWKKDDLAQDLYEKSVEKFQENEIEESLKLLNLAQKLSVNNPEYIEAEGVILGRVERYPEAIQAMDRLLIADEDSIMAHTNKSLYLMKMGKIEEAEDEKAKATLKEFKRLGKEASNKREKEEQEEKKKQDLLKRKEMFSEVLEIDPEDGMANFGLAEIYFELNQGDQANKYAAKAYQVGYKHPPLYLLYTKILKNLGDETYQTVANEGIKISLNKGNEMCASQLREIIG